MSSTTSIFAIILSAVLTNNFIFSQFLGCCPFLGCSSKIDTAAGMGLAVTFVMGLASAICWLVNCLLVKLGLGFLQTIAYILVIAALVQFIEMFLKKSIPSLYSALGIYLPLITTNCAVLGVVLLNTQYSFGFLQSVSTVCSAVSASCSPSACSQACARSSSLPTIRRALRASRSASSPPVCWPWLSWASPA